jgi:adenylylsulfate kinase-like enzyme
MNGRLPFLWLCGPMGVGKSSVGWEIFSQLRKEGIKSGYADADQLGLCYPCPDDDPVNQRIKSRNVGAVFKTYREAGARCFILVGSASTAEEVAMYSNQVPDSTLILCMLFAESSVIEQRFLQRGWQADRVNEAVKEAAELDRADFADFRVDTTSQSVKEVAQVVRVQAGDWPGLAPA